MTTMQLLGRWLSPTETRALPRLTASYLPHLTLRLVQWTYAHLFGACPPLDPADVLISLKPPPQNPAAEASSMTAAASTVPPTVIAQTVLVCLLLVGFIVVGTQGFSQASTWIGPPLFLSCSSNFWEGSIYGFSQDCGLLGEGCRPFNSSIWFALACPSGCATDATVSNFVVGGPFYTADSDVCAAATHAGVVSDSTGGCFEMRFAGEQLNYSGSSANQVQSQSFGWFVRSLEFRPTRQASHCASIEYGYDIVACLVMFLLLVVWRCPPMVGYYAMIQAGFYCAGLINASPQTPFWNVVNDLQKTQFVVIPISMLLWRFFTPLADPRILPLETFLLQFAPFWLIIHLQDINSAGINFTVSGESQRLNTASVVVIILVVVVVVLIVPLQVRNLYRAGLFPRILFWAFPFCLYLVVLKLAAPNQLVFHFHHYFIGLVLIALCRGQTFYNLVINGLAMGFFVNGLVVYGASPLYDDKDASVGSGATDELVSPQGAPIWTMLNQSTIDGSVYLEWRMPQDLALHWDQYNCSTNVTAAIPELEYYIKLARRNRRLLFEESPYQLEPDSPYQLESQVTPTVDNVNSSAFRYLLAANGLLIQAGLGNAFAGFLPVANATLTLLVALQMPFSGGPGPVASVLLPFPVPANVSNGAAHFGYYNESAATLCDILEALYVQQ